MSKVVPGSEETIRRIEDGIARMKKLDRQLFMSVRFDHLSYDEAGRLHGVTRQQVERSIVRALRVIRATRQGRLLGENSGIDSCASILPTLSDLYRVPPE